MTAEDLYEDLKSLKAYKEDRVRIGMAAVRNELLQEVIQFCNAGSSVSHQSCWSLEQSFLLHEGACYPHLTNIARLFTQPINTSGMRSLTKIADICCRKYYSKRSYDIKTYLTSKHREQMLEGCFRTLIEHEGKTANQAFATRALFQLGKEFEWVHPELKIRIIHIMDQNPTSGYRACAKDILEKIKTYNHGT